MQYLSVGLEFDNSGKGAIISVFGRPLVPSLASVQKAPPHNPAQSGMVGLYNAQKGALQKAQNKKTPPPQASGPGRSHSAGQPEAPPGPSSTSNALSLLDEELLCLGAYWRGLLGASGASGEVLGMPRGGPRVLSKGGK